MSNKLTPEQVGQIADLMDIPVGNDVSRQASVKALGKITELTPNVFVTDILDTLNTSDNPFNIFIKRDVQYGNQVRYVSTGVIDAQEYKDDLYTPADGTVPFVPDYEDYSTTNLMEMYPMQYNRPRMTDYFKSIENLTTFINKIRGAIDKSRNRDMLNMFLYLFGNTTVNLPQFIKTEVDKTKAKIVNTKEIGTFDSMTKVFKEIIKVATDMGDGAISPKKDYNIGFSNGEQSGTSLNKSSMKSDLVLIISKNDIIDMSAEVSNIYHQGFYDLEQRFYKVIPCEIPSGTCFIVDKESIRMDIKLDEMTSGDYLNLNNAIVSHFWFFMGIFKYGNGIKLTYTYTPKSI